MTTDMLTKDEFQCILQHGRQSDFKFIIFTMDLKTQIEALNDGMVMGFVYLDKTPKYSRNLFGLYSTLR